MFPSKTILSSLIIALAIHCLPLIIKAKIAPYFEQGNIMLLVAIIAGQMSFLLLPMGRWNWIKRGVLYFLALTTLINIA
ncbi:MAG: hypothetical protein NTX25_07580, partial [Proteobacteria bacterium]|nr:hypothetical protein [Pseudomonadota bacterium]